MYIDNLMTTLSTKFQLKFLRAIYQFIFNFFFFILILSFSPFVFAQKTEVESPLKILWVLKLNPVIVERNGKFVASVRGLEFYRHKISQKYFLKTTEDVYSHADVVDMPISLSTEPWTGNNGLQGVSDVTSLRAFSSEHELKLHFFPNGTFRGFLDSHVIPTQKMRYHPASMSYLSGEVLDWYAPLPPVVEPSLGCITFYALMKTAGDSGSLKLLAQKFDHPQFSSIENHQTVYYRATFNKGDSQSNINLNIIARRGLTDSEDVPEVIGSRMDIGSKQAKAMERETQSSIKISINPSGLFNVVWPEVGTFYLLSAEFASHKSVACSSLKKN